MSYCPKEYISREFIQWVVIHAVSIMLYIFIIDDVRDKISTSNTFKEIGKLILMHIVHTCLLVYCDNMQIKSIYRRQWKTALLNLLSLKQLFKVKHE